MSSTTRTRLLLGGMILVGIVMLGDQFGMLESLEKFGSQLPADLAKVNKQIEVAEDLILQGVHAQDALLALEVRSLPFDRELARSQYQGWLSQLIQEHQLTQSTVDVGAPSVVALPKLKREAYTAYPFAVSAGGTLTQVTAFLYDYYQGPHLQKIDTLSLSPAGGSRFTMSIAGEVLCLPSCDRKSEMSTAGPYRLTAPLADYQTIVRRDIFSREAAATLKQVRLTSVTFDKSGLPEAWFQLGAQQTTSKLHRGQQLAAATHQLEVIDIQPRAVLVELDGDVMLVPLGQSLHEAQLASQSKGAAEETSLQRPQ